MEQHGGIPAAQFLFQFQWNRVYAITQSNGFPRTSLFHWNSFFYLQGLQPSTRNGICFRGQYILSPLCPFRDILFFLALLIRFSPYLMFNYTYCSVLLPETTIVHVKKAKYRPYFVLQSVSDRCNVKLGRKSFEMCPSSNILEGNDLKIIQINSECVRARVVQ